MEDKLKRRKLDALKRGVHRLSDDGLLPVATHAVGIGKAGAGAVAEILRNLEADAPKFNGLVVDIGEQDLGELKAVLARTPPARADVKIVALEVPDRATLFDALQHYPEFLALEYPRYYWGAGYKPWLPATIEMPVPGSRQRRATAKAIYGCSYYGGARVLQRALRDFVTAIEASPAQTVVSIIFGLGGGTGSGIAVDLARHMSNSLLGRRILVAGIAIAPCGGDTPEHRGAQVFATLNELDCLGDEAKNSGVVASCGELFRNPFTAGFLLIPQQHIWDSTGDLALTQKRGNEEIAALLTARGGANLWELLRLLNWVAAPSTQHSAARTPWGLKWIHMLGFVDPPGGPVPIDPALPTRLGLLGTYAAEFIEVRVPTCTDEERAHIADSLEQVFGPDVPPQLVAGRPQGSVQFILPSVRKADLAMFHAARALYDESDLPERLLAHSLLLEQGLVLSEPSTRLSGMAGAGIQGSESWIAVPLDDLRGDNESQGREATGSAGLLPQRRETADKKRAFGLAL